MKTILFYPKKCIVVGVLFIVSAVAGICEARHLVFNFTGSFHGYGDITGPLWVVSEMRQLLPPEDEFSIVVDERAVKILREIFDQAPLSDIANRFKVTFVPVKETKQLKKADFSFELNFGARLIHHLTDLNYNTDQTVSIISDTMMHKTLDEVRFMGTQGGESHLYFKPPGIGPNRSGIFNDPDLLHFQGKSLQERRLFVASLFANSPIQKMLQHIENRPSKIGFLYGVHNEVIDKNLIGQTHAYLKKLGIENPDQPVLVLTPNNVKELRAALPTNYPILQLKDLTERRILHNGVHLVSVGKVSSQKFMGLMAISDVPVLIEGNSAISSALRLELPFWIYRGCWNDPQIQDIIEMEMLYCKSHHFADMYSFKKGVRPNLDAFGVPPEDREKFYHTLAKGVAASLPQKLLFVMDIVTKLRGIESMKSSPKERDNQIVALANEAEKKDEILGYSLIEDMFARYLLSESIKTQWQNNLQKSGIDPRKMEKKFIPNRPRFSEKLVALEKGLITRDEWVGPELRRMPVRDLTEDVQVQGYLKQHKLYVSLTSPSVYIPKLQYVLDTLDLTYIEAILVCLPDSPDYVVPDWLRRYPRVKILRIPTETRPLSSLIPAAEYVRKQDPDGLLLTIDPDVGYPIGMINEVLYQTVRHPHTLLGTTTEIPVHKKYPKLTLPSFPGKEKHASPSPIQPASALKESMTDVKIVSSWGSIAYPVQKLDLAWIDQLRTVNESCMKADDLVVSFALAFDEVPLKNYHTPYFNKSMLRAFEYGRGDTASEKKKTGEFKVQVTLKEPGYTDGTTYLACYKGLVDVSYDAAAQKYLTKAEILKKLESQSSPKK